MNQAHLIHLSQLVDGLERRAVNLLKSWSTRDRITHADIVYLKGYVDALLITAQKEPQADEPKKKK